MRKKTLAALALLGIAAAAPAHATVFVGSAMFSDVTSNNALIVTGFPNPASFTSGNLSAGQSTYLPGLMTLSTQFNTDCVACSSTDQINLAITWTSPGNADTAEHGTVTESKTTNFFFFFPVSTSYDGTLRWSGNSQFDASVGKDYVAQTVDFSNGARAEIDLYDTKLTGTSSALAAQFDVRIKDLKDPVRVPEPASLALIGAGLLGLGIVRRKRA